MEFSMMVIMPIVPQYRQTLQSLKRAGQSLWRILYTCTAVWYRHLSTSMELCGTSILTGLQRTTMINQLLLIIQITLKPRVSITHYTTLSQLVQWSKAFTKSINQQPQTFIPYAKNQQHTKAHLELSDLVENQIDIVLHPRKCTPNW